MPRRSLLVYSLLAAVWVLVAGWQTEEHVRLREAAKTDLRGRAKDIANTLGAFIRGLRFRGTVRQDRLEPVLEELINERTNELVKSSELISIALLNAANEPVASAGKSIDFSQMEILQGERWGRQSVTLVTPVDLGPIVILPPRTNSGPEGFRGGGFSRREPPPADDLLGTNGTPPPTNTQTAALAAAVPRGEGDPPGPPPAGESRPRRPPWLRGLDDKEYQALIEKRGLHGLVLALSTEPFLAAATQDLWLRSIIIVLATVSVLGSGLAWRNLARTSDLQLRLVRTSELNTHLKEMNLAAAGLAHETRNPLNIIRGRAQMISREAEAAPEIRERSREIIDEADKVAAQLNEFINYSRPREVRRTRLALNSIVNEVVRALSYDVEEKSIQLQVIGEHLAIEADEQLLRQALFNLLLNAIQAVSPAGEIQVFFERRTPAEAILEVRDNGPGVPADHRTEIFKPYFTTQKKGTGLGLAVVQQIVLAHGWEIQCLPNEPAGAIFRIAHLKPCLV